MSEEAPAMTPEPMSYTPGPLPDPYYKAGIVGILGESCYAAEQVQAHTAAEVARAVAARDAQWREMLGEPVAWHINFIGDDGTADWVDVGRAMPAKVTGARLVPLYAIKDKP